MGKDDNLTEEGIERYLAYANRLRPLLLMGRRYLAYTSDFGEAFRPLTTPFFVNTTYAISFGYVGFEIAQEAYKSHSRSDHKYVFGTHVAKHTIFQTLASLALPAFTIHSTVKYSGILFKNVKNQRVLNWGPTFLGLAVIPFLPTLIDHPAELIVDKVFEPFELYAKQLADKDK
jgi:fission process protein 1